MNAEKVYLNRDVYYRIKVNRKEKVYTVCEMQWFDEYDYDQDSLLPFYFDCEFEAKGICDFLNNMSLLIKLNKSELINFWG